MDEKRGNRGPSERENEYYSSGSESSESGSLGENSGSSGEHSESLGYYSDYSDGSSSEGEVGGKLKVSIQGECL